MSDIQPRGIPVMVDGVERHFLFTLSTVDRMQDQFGKNIFQILGDATKDDSADAHRVFISVVTILLNEEADRSARAVRRGSAEYKEAYPVLTEEDVGDIIDIRNYGTFLKAVMDAYGITMPEPDDDDTP